MITECSSCGSNKVEANSLCASCNHMLRKSERQALKDASKVKKPVKKVSPKHRKELADYTVQRSHFLSAHIECMARVSPQCDGHACEIHHSAKRGANLLNIETFVAVCRPCHLFIETVMSAEERREKGLLKTSFNNDPEELNP